MKDKNKDFEKSITMRNERLELIKERIEWRTEQLKHPVDRLKQTRQEKQLKLRGRTSKVSGKNS